MPGGEGGSVLVDEDGREKLIAYVTELLTQRAVIVDDTTPRRVATTIVTAVLLEIGHSLPQALGVPEKPAGIPGLHWIPDSQ